MHDNQLNQLKSALNPSDSWVDGQRELLTNIARDVAANQSMAQWRYRGGLTWQLRALQAVHGVFPTLRRVVVTFLVVFLSGAGVLTAQVSRAAVVGDALYPIKRNIEKLELVLATSSQREAAVYLKHVAARLQEISDIQTRDLTPEDMERRLSQSVDTLNRDLTAAQQSLEIAARDGQVSVGVLSVAKDLNRQAKQAARLINRTTLAKAQKTTTNLKESAAVAIDTTERAQAASLSILIEKISKAQVAAEPEDIEATQAEAKVLLLGQLDEVSVRQVSAEAAVSNLLKPETKFKVNQALVRMYRVSSIVPFTQTDVDSTKVKLEASGKLLTLSRALVEDGKLVEAFSRVQEAKQTIEEVGKVVKKVSAALEDASLFETFSSTSTAPVTTTTAPQVQPDPAADQVTVTQPKAGSAAGTITVVDDSLGQLEAAASAAER